MFARFSTQSSTCSRRVANGRRCPRTCRRRARRIRTSCCGIGTERWSASTTRSTSLRASARAVKPAQPPDHRQSKRQSGSKGGSTLDPQGFDAAKKVTGRKRHILVDTLGLLLNVVVHSAAMQDRDGALLVLKSAHTPLLPLHQVYLR